jgi:hypothetical protein
MRARRNKWAVSHHTVTLPTSMVLVRAGRAARMRLATLIAYSVTCRHGSPKARCRNVTKIARYELPDHHDVAINVNVSLLQQEVLRFNRWKRPLVLPSEPRNCNCSLPLVPTLIFSIRGGGGGRT